MKTIIFSLMAPLAAATIILSAPVEPRAEVTLQTCEDDYVAQLKAAEDNRKKAVKQLEDALARTADDQAAANLNTELERAWEQEEEFRGIASTGYRDCIKFVKSKS